MKYDVIFILEILRRKYLTLLLLFTLYLVIAFLSVVVLGYSRLLVFAYDAIVEQVVDTNDGIIVSSFAISPFTSVIDPRQLEERLKSVGNITINYYFVTIAIVYDKPVIVVGDLGLEEQCAFIGSGLLKSSTEKDLFLPLYSVFTGETLILRVCGVNDKPYLKVSKEVATRIRGISPEYYTLAVIKVGRNEDREEVIKRLEIEPALHGLIARALVVLEKGVGNVSGKLYSTLSDYYLSRLGVSKDFVIYFSSVTALSTLVGTTLAGYGVILSLKDVLRVLRLAGVSRRGVVVYSCVYTLSITTPASLIAPIVIKLVPGVEVLGFVLQLESSFYDVLPVLLVVPMFTTIGVIWGIRCEIE